MTGRRSQSAEGLQGGLPLQSLLGRPRLGEPGGGLHEHHGQAGAGHRHRDTLAGGGAAPEESQVPYFCATGSPKIIDVNQMLIAQIVCTLTQPLTTQKLQHIGTFDVDAIAIDFILKIE